MLPSDDDKTKKTVDRLFDEASAEGASRLRMLDVLQKIQDEVPEEDAPKIYDSMSKDNRLKAFLPDLAISTLSADLPLKTTEYGAFSVTTTEIRPYGGDGQRGSIDRNQDGEITRTELFQASRDPRFNAVQRKAIERAVEDFDGLRSYARQDGGFLFGNASGITGKDLRKAYLERQDRPQIKPEIDAVKELIDNFEVIDKNHTGKITFNEVRNWRQEARAAGLPDQKIGPGAVLVDLRAEEAKVWAAPKRLGNGRSEELTKAALQAKIDSLLEADQSLVPRSQRR